MIANVLYSLGATTSYFSIHWNFKNIDSKVKFLIILGKWNLRFTMTYSYRSSWGKKKKKKCIGSQKAGEEAPS